MHESDKKWLDNLERYHREHKNPHVQRKFDTAYNFYTKEAGFNHYDALSHMDGINFNRSVKRVEVGAGKQFKRYSSNPRIKGNHAYLARQDNANRLGISGISKRSQDGKKLHYYTTNKSTPVLVSTARDMNSLQTGELYFGGGKQYLVPNKDSLSHSKKGFNHSDFNTSDSKKVKQQEMDSKSNNRDRQKAHEEKIATWSTKREGPRLYPNDPQSTRIYKREFPQQNSKTVKGANVGEHKWYDPKTGREGWTPSKAEGRGQAASFSPSKSGPQLVGPHKGQKSQNTRTQSTGDPRITAARLAKSGRSELGIYNGLKQHHSDLAKSNPEGLRRLAKQAYRGQEKRQQSLQKKEPEKNRNQVKSEENRRERPTSANSDRKSMEKAKETKTHTEGRYATTRNQSSRQRLPQGSGRGRGR